MGEKDIITKDYMADCKVFADAFNYLLHNGEQIIDPNQLRTLDTTVIGVPYGIDGAAVPTQKFRDEFKCLTAMEDDSMVYVLLGIENQSEIHYAMPVKNMVYDALQYAAQVEQAAKSYRAARKRKNSVSNEMLKQKTPNRGEYLSGFHRDDQLLPVITLVVFFGAQQWDGPMCLHDMLAVRERKLLSFVSDYRINLIAPAELCDDELNCFVTSLREVMLFIKYSRDKNKLNDLLKTDIRFKTVEQKAARVINSVMDCNLKFDLEEEVVDMCLAIDEMRKDAQMEGIEQGVFVSIRNLMETMDLSAEQAMTALKIPQQNRAIYTEKLQS